MNAAATQDVRAIDTVPLLERAAQGLARPPTPQAAQMLRCWSAWRKHGGNRLDLNLDGKIDDPGAAIMDAAWPKIADAFMRAAARPQLDELNTPGRACSTRRRAASTAAGISTSTATSRKLLHIKQPQPFANDYCGAGNLKRCQNDVWAAIAAAGRQLAQQQHSTNPAPGAPAPPRSGSRSSPGCCRHDALHQPAERHPAGDQLQPPPLSSTSEPAGATAGGLKLRTAGTASPIPNRIAVIAAHPYRVVEGPTAAATGPLSA